MLIRTDSAIFRIELLPSGIIIHTEEVNLEERDIAWLFQELYERILDNGDDFYKRPQWDILQFNQGVEAENKDYTGAIDSGLWLNDFVSGPAYLRSTSSVVKNNPDDKENYIDIVLKFPLPEKN